jgi:hypothetical protein
MQLSFAKYEGWLAPNDSAYDGVRSALAAELAAVGGRR